MIAIITLLVALVGILALFVIKQWESRQRRMLFPAWRTRSDVFVVKSVTVIRHHLPGAGKRYSKKIARGAAYYTSTLLLRGVRVIEQQLVGFINMIKGRGEVKTNGTASAFLRDVSDHKNNLKENNSNTSV